MALLIECPNCGSRAFTEYWFGGEIVPQPNEADRTDERAEFERVWLRSNTAGEQDERWFHFAGCRRWLTVRRDTRNNLFLAADNHGGVSDGVLHATTHEFDTDGIA